MARDYLKEFEREKKIVKRYTIKLNKEVAEVFDKKLEEDGRRYTEFFKSAVNKYINKKE